MKGVEDNKASIIMAKGNFWGRSITASGACDDPIRYTKFGPFTPGFPLVNWDDLADLERMLQEDPNVCAVYLEPIQGEGGINVPQDSYFGKVKALCKKYDCLLISDEVQTGFGRTGKLMAYEHDMADDKPDILVLAKSVSGGITPVSGFMANDDVML